MSEILVGDRLSLYILNLEKPDRTGGVVCAAPTFFGSVLYSLVGSMSVSI